MPPEYTLTHPEIGDADKVLALQTACDVAEYGEPDSDLEDLLDDWKELDLQQSAWLVCAGVQVLKRGEEKSDRI